jgi:hypothetical protein
MTLKGVLGLGAVLAVTGAAVAAQWPEVQRYLKVRRM